MFTKYLLILCVFIVSFASNSYAANVQPQEPEDNIGHFCNMTITNHTASKAQLFLKNKPNKPLWFSTIRDLFIYINSPEEDQRILAIYVNDMGIANWDSPEPDTWANAYDAIYVIESKRLNGMGGASIVPFTNTDKANDFIKSYGGEIKNFNSIPKDYIFSID